MSVDLLNDQVRKVLSPSIELSTWRVDPQRSFEVLSSGTGDDLALCLHGFPEHAISWRHQLPHLADLGLRAVAPNLRGYGHSFTPPRVRDYAMKELLDDVAALIDHAAPRSTTLIAHDWGGAIAWMFALLEVRPVDRLVIMNLPHPQRFAEELRSLRQLLRSWYVFFFQLPWLPQALLGAGRARGIARAFTGMTTAPENFPDELLQVYRLNARRPGGLRAMIHYYRAALRHPLPRDEMRRALSNRLQHPTLMLWGEQDTALDIRLVDGTDALVDDFELVKFPGASHWVQQDVPEEVNAELTRWFSAHALPGPSRVDGVGVRDGHA